MRSGGLDGVAIRLYFRHSCKLISLETLKRRRTNTCITFLFDLLEYHVDAPILRDMLQFHEAVRVTRSRRIFQIESHATNYARNQPLNRISNLFNSVAQLYTVGMSREVFRSRIKALTSINSLGNSA